MPRLGVACAAVLAFGLAVSQLAGTLDPGAVRARPTVAVRLSASPLDGLDSVAPVGFDGPNRPVTGGADKAGSSRLWFAHGRWWALLPDARGSSIRIWGLNGPDGPWVDTGVVVDDRADARVDLAWAGDRLVVSTSGTRTYRSDALRINRFHYGDGGWVRDADFPVAVSDRGLPDTQVAVAADGRVWLARSENGALLVSSSDPTAQAFSAFEPVPGGLAAADVGGFDLVADGSVLRIAWRSVTTDTLGIISRSAKGWSQRLHTIYGIGGTAPIAAEPAGPGRPGVVFVVASTTLSARGTSDEDPSIVLIRAVGGHATTAVVAEGRDGLSLPNLVVNRADGRVHVLSVADPQNPPQNGKPPSYAITDKGADADAPAFGPGQGTALIRRAGVKFRTPLVPTAPASEASGFVVMGTADGIGRWTSAVLGGTAPPDAPIVASARSPILHDTFEARPPGPGAPGGWYGDGKDVVQASITASGAVKGRSLVLANADGGAAPTACRAVTPVGNRPVTVEAVVTSIGRSQSDARLLTLKGSEGTLASARLTKRGQVGWAGANGRAAAGLVGDATPLVVTITVDPTADTAVFRFQVRGGALVAESPAVPLLSTGAGGVDEICLTPAPDKPGAHLELDDLLVTDG